MIELLVRLLCISPVGAYVAMYNITEMVVFCKQKTAYEMRISDWSSDVCSSDLKLRRPLESRLPLVLQGCLHQGDIGEVREHVGQPATGTLLIDRKNVV